ncbi:hypothetical protein M9194_14770 [Vibrio sp. S4M6]|uniref:hypothetical protein n=1 Tax=Vibrio sinus TaxID=2946865 RepID=UPI002029F05C|nr:hypothetical protein [Vibrio sinus]MCL9782696.1 hypothetical protein [Vibrio sinus]
MRQQYHFRRSNQGLLAWDVSRLVRLSQHLKVIEVKVASIKELDEAFWYDLGGESPTCRNILQHINLINRVDLRYPIILCHEGRLMDGMHRVCKSALLGKNTILAVQFPSYIEPDYIGVDPDDLPY